MTTIKSQFILAGTTWQPAQIEALAYQRNLHVLHSMQAHGLTIKDGATVLDNDAIDYLTAAQAWAVSINNRLAYTGEQIASAYQESFAKSNDMWRELAFDPDQPMKVSHCDMLVEGTSLQTFMAIMQKMQQDERVGLSVHPEHFQSIMRPDEIIGIEPFGMYGTPTLVRVAVIPDTDLNAHILADQDAQYPLSMAGSAALIDDGTPVNIPYHQFQPTANGFKAKLAVYWPAGVADEIVSGHELHLATEFYYGLKLITAE